MKSLVIKRSIVIDGHKTSISLEEPFWAGLKEIAHDQNMTLSGTVGAIDTARRQGNLSSAIRLFVLERARVHAQARPARQNQDVVAHETA
jgi:predicted DNA-binding ribbon-helix-helix protein